MVKKSIHAQASAVDVVCGFTGRKPPKLSQSQEKMLEEGLAAASRTLWIINASRDRLPTGLLEELEGI